MKGVEDRRRKRRSQLGGTRTGAIGGEVRSTLVWHQTLSRIKARIDTSWVGDMLRQLREEAVPNSGEFAFRGERDGDEAAFEILAIRNRDAMAHRATDINTQRSPSRSEISVELADVLLNEGVVKERMDGEFRGSRGWWRSGGRGSWGMRSCKLLGNVEKTSRWSMSRRVGLSGWSGVSRRAGERSMRRESR